MLVVALSLSEQVEKIGAYAGVAAFFGFAVLAVLTFAQAREIKRLRDWAGRAPERAAELEARVMADAARRARPVTPAAAAKPPAAAQPVAVPAAVAAGAAPAAAPAQTSATESGDGEAEAKPAEAATGDGDATPAAAAVAGNGDAKPAEPDAPGAAGEAPAAAEPDATDQPEAAAGPAPAKPGNGAAGGEVPPLPRATPPPRPGGTAPPPRPRPTAPAAPLRAAGPAARRPAAPPVRRPAQPAPDEGRSGGRVALLAGGALVGLIALAFAVTQIFAGEDEPPPPNRTAAEATTEPTAEPTEAAGGPTSGPSRADTTVAVLNGTTIAGLAANTAEKVAQAGFKRGNTDDYSDQARSASLVFYAADARRRALEVARVLEIPASSVREMDQNAQAIAGGAADVVVVVGADQAP